ncbi:MAG: AbrB/MazE/SpoVT family DNA-binding domain-containing protein, partial [archaeon]|nr:AbrB/MazE/SpoVT family DNA-binding domain-containing protein [archaeon]
MSQDSSFRKLQVTGGSTVIVSLPKSWVEQNKLSKGDVVNLHEMQSGDLKISPISQNSLKSSVSIDSTMIG